MTDTILCPTLTFVTQKYVPEREKSTAMKLAELRLGRPVEDVIREVYDAGGFQKDVAVALGIDVSTVSRWMRELGIKARRRGNGSAAQLM